MKINERVKKFLFDNNFNIVLLFITLLAFHICYGLEVINPTNINWLMSAYHDWGQHYLGWAFYRNEPWTFPIGTIESYNYPVGSNIGFTDSIPLLALLFKPFSFLLPDDFQYIGAWLFMCYYFTAIYTYKILKLYTCNKWIIILGVILIIANPVLLFRSIHPALCSQFLILGSIYNYLRPSVENSKRINFQQILLFLISALLTPYLSVMIFGFNILVPLKHYYFDKSITFKKWVLYPFLSFFLLFTFWFIIGMIEFNNSTNVASVEPFSYFSFNLNSFFDSYGYYSKILPDLGRVDPRQYEGFAYLGIGMMILIFASFIYTLSLLVHKRISFHSMKKWGLLLLLCFAMFLFAITNVLTFNKETLITFPLPGIIEKLGFIFRASGRFVWPFYYLLFIGSIIVFIKIKMKHYLKVSILSMITIVQLYDIQELYTHWNFSSSTYKTPLHDEKWIKVMKTFDDIIIYPSFDYNYSINYTNDYQDLSYLALKAGKPISNGYVARANVAKSQAFIMDLEVQLRSGVIEPNRLYITTEKHINAFEVLLNNELVDIHKMNNFIFIYKKKNTLKSKDFKENFQTKVFLDSIQKQYKEQKAASLEPVDYDLNTDKAVKYYFDSFVFEGHAIKIRGWAFLEESKNNQNDTIFLLLNNDKGSFEIKLKPESRPDITSAFGKENLDNAGFSSVVFTNTLPKGNYSLGIVIKNNNEEIIYVKSDKNILIK